MDIEVSIGTTTPPAPTSYKVLNRQVMMLETKTHVQTCNSYAHGASKVANQHIEPDDSANTLFTCGADAYSALQQYCAANMHSMI